MPNTPTPPPGSPTAVQRGCTCPTLGNNDGEGRDDQPGEFLISAYCPLHGFGIQRTQHQLKG